MTGSSYERALADAGVTLEELTRLEAAATKAPWESDVVQCEGSYGSGPNTSEGFNARQMFGPDGKSLFDSLNTEAAYVHEDYDAEGGGSAWYETAKCNFDLIAAARNALPALLAGCREADDQRARADKVVAEAEALRVERDEARAEFEELLSEWDDYEKKFRAAEAALAEAQRQAAEAERKCAAAVQDRDFIMFRNMPKPLAPPSAPGSAETEGDKP